MLQETKSIYENYILWTLISKVFSYKGQGSYGMVYKCYDTSKQEYVAIKKSKIQTQKEGLHSSHIREITILNMLQHDNIVKLKDVVLQKSFVYLIFEYFEKDLKNYYLSLQQSQIDKKKVKLFMYKILSAVNYCHQKNIMHRDLKPQNILIDSQNNNIKLIDFGIARLFCSNSRPYTDKITSLWYRAPEMVFGDLYYTNSVDIWSIGCIFIELVSKKPQFVSNSEIQLLTKIVLLLGSPTQQTWPEFTRLPKYQIFLEIKQFKKINIQLINKKFSDQLATDLFLVRYTLNQKMMKYNHKQRISVRQALLHPYFNDIK